MTPIDCFLTSRDLMAVASMAERLCSCAGVGRIVIVDCESTFPPLLEWYEEAERNGINVERCVNLGNKAPWVYSEVMANQNIYFTSDGDLDLDDVPLDFLLYLREGLVEHPEAMKVGLSLRLDDLPDTYLGRWAKNHEKQFWERLDGRWYHADIDTTACVYRPLTGWGGYGPCLRSAPPYTARHISWYLDPANLPEDYKWYTDRLSPEGIFWGPVIKELRGTK